MVFDVERVGLPCDCVEEVTDVEGDGGGAAEDARMIDVEDHRVLAMCVEPSFEFAREGR